MQNNNQISVDNTIICCTVTLTIHYWKEKLREKNPIYVQVLVVQLYLTLLEKEIKKKIPMIVASK